jgi:2-dehydro-3-deoxyphosphogluconate aldolase/(4S)-4-hydroxy-2-oxoglutarate aldolase
MDRPPPPPGPVIAIVRGHGPGEVAGVADGLAAAGVGTVEVTLDSPDALESVAALAARGGFEVGAGTVRTPAEAEAAVAAGATFLVSPHLDVAVVARAVALRASVLPGALTPTEIVAAWEAGASAVKVFPAGPLGAAYLAALRQPLAGIPLVPTGGVDVGNARAFLDAGALALGVGGWLTGDPDREVVEERARLLLAACAGAFS